MDQSGKKRPMDSNTEVGPSKKTKITPRETKPRMTREEWEKKQPENQRVLAAHNLGGKQNVVPTQSFVRYYQEIIGPEQWSAFLEFLSKELPTTFRIASLGGFTQLVKTVLDKIFLGNTDLKSLQIGDVKIDIELPRALDWYPFKDLAWHYSVNKKGLRRTEILKAVKKILAREQEIVCNLILEGRLQRQEAVSMIPPLLADIQPHHKVLDMCAAPGSKTGQLIELLHAGLKECQIPEGCIIANDLDVKRCYLLTHITQQLGSPSFMVTNYNAQFFPSLTLPDNSPFLFDRIICDVPCSGDGTIRKQPNIANRWAYKNGMTFHAVQLSIATRGFELLKPGGIMVYSTCSLNPLENESVVASLLHTFHGSIELLDQSAKLPTLKRASGIQSWRVFSPVDDQQEITKWESGLHSLITKTLFPPKAKEGDEKEKAIHHKIHNDLPKCLRLYPHLQDTGGFFIAVLQKTKPAQQQTSSEEKAEVEVQSTAPLSWNQQKKLHKRKLKTEAGTPKQAGKQSTDDQTKEKGDRGYPKVFMEDPFTIPSDQTSQSINNAYIFFGFDSIEQTKALGLQNLLTRSSQQSNKVYLMNNTLFDLLKGNAEKIVQVESEEQNSTQLRVINAGVRLFSNEIGRNKKLELASPWRISSEGLPYLIPHIKCRLAEVSIIDFAMLLVTKRPMLYTEFTNELTKKVIKSLSVGSCIIRAVPPTEPIVLPTDFMIEAFIDRPVTESGEELIAEEKVVHPILEQVVKGVDWAHFKSVFTKDYFFPAWNGKASVTLHISKVEKQSLRDLFLSSTCNYKELDPRKALQGED